MTTATKIKTALSTGTLTKNVVQFRNKFVNLPSAGKNNRELAMSVLSELMQFGYVLSPEALENLSAASREDIINFHNEVVSYLKFLTGAGREYKPFWPGFPEQVMEKTEAELWLHQIIYYMTNCKYEPTAWTKERGTAFEQSKYTQIDAGSEERFEKIFTTLVSVNQSLSPEDLGIIKWFVESKSVLRFPDRIPFKENLCTLASMGLDVPVKTVTDVLRIAVGMSGGDISLPAVPPAQVQMNRWSGYKSNNPAREAFKFRKFSRSERRLIMSLLEKTNCDSTEAVLKEGRWVRLGEILHPGEYASKFPKAANMFKNIRNENIQSWYGKVNKAFDKSFAEGVKVLSERAGEFVRRMDWMLRAQKETSTSSKTGSSFSILEKYATKEPHIALGLKERQEIVLSVFKEIGKNVSNKVLFEVYNHFERRYEPTNNRTIMVKGARKRTKLDELPAIAPETIEAVQRTIVDTLLTKFAEMPKLGKIAIDEELKKIPMPTNMRSVSATLRPAIRGQRIPIGNKNAKVVRAYVHWVDKTGNEDIDLHGFLIGNSKFTTFGFNGEHNAPYGCYSGDVRHRQGDCAEYLDIDFAAAKRAGFKYLIVTVNHFNGRNFSTLDCYSGFMEREFPEVDKMFKPSTVGNSIKLAGEASTAATCAIDLETREYIHLDIDANGLPVASRNVGQIMEAVQFYLTPPKFSVYDLLMLHASARGEEIVDGKDVKADTYFTFEEFSESYVRIMEYMGI